MSDGTATGLIENTIKQPKSECQLTGAPEISSRLATGLTVSWGKVEQRPGAGGMMCGTGGGARRTQPPSTVAANSPYPYRR